ncbi:MULTISPECIES: ATP-binding protein [unclassified Lysinibacillus]|uniref:HD domain-containing protein n=1 Tax=unclassified Lysinibacillus TaxID=2636778 RepID=UPI003808CEBB
MISITYSKIYNKLLEHSHHEPEVRSLLSIVESGVEYAEGRTKTVIRYMDEYTLHDETHLHRILSLMEKIIPETTLNNLQPLELALLILSAFFHDLGMAPKEKEIKIYKGLLAKDEKLSDEEEILLENFYIYCESNLSLKQRIERAYKSGDLGLARILESHRITEYIRVNHSIKIKEIIQDIENNEVWAKCLKYKNFSFGRFLSKICESHNENILEINNPLINTSIPVAPDEYLNSLFLSIVLRLADILDFDAERTPDVLYNHLDIQNPISVQEWSKHRSIQSWSISGERIMFAAECEHPAIEKTIKEFCNYIEEELYNCKIALNGMYDRQRENLKDIYNMPLPYEVNTSEVRAKVDYDGHPIYTYKDLSFNLDQQEIIKLLMGTSLYGNSSVALREILQNAIDACRVRSICSKNWGETGYKAVININLLEDSHNEYYLEITDNGIGMDENIILNYFSNVGKSYYKSEEFMKLQTNIKSNYSPISNFGIGFLSVFMIADQVDVQTTKIIDRYKTSQPLDLTIDGLSGLFYFNKGINNIVGTKITLKLKEEHNLPLDKNSLKKYVEDLINFSNDIEIFIDNERIETNKIELYHDHQWKMKSQYIKYYDLDICEEGIFGKVRVALLAEDDTFLTNIIINTNYFEEIELSETLRINTNMIQKESESIDIDGAPNTGWSTHITTNGKIYLKGILVDDEIFESPDFWKNNEKGKIKLPFPVNFIINLSNERNLNLNAARDKIILDEKWNDFKNTLTRVVLSNLLKQFNNVNKILSFQKVYGTEFNDIFESLVQNRIKELEVLSK